jgi:hypothetical protein
MFMVVCCAHFPAAKDLLEKRQEPFWAGWSLKATRCTLHFLSKTTRILPHRPHVNPFRLWAVQLPSASGRHPYLSAVRASAFASAPLPPFPSAALRETAALTPPPGSSLPLTLKALPFRWHSTPGLPSWEPVIRASPARRLDLSLLPTLKIQGGRGGRPNALFAEIPLRSIPGVSRFRAAGHNAANTACLKDVASFPHSSLNCPSMEDAGSSRTPRQKPDRRSTDLIAVPRDYFLGPVFAATKQTGPREVTIGDRRYLIGGFHPMRPNSFPPAMDQPAGGSWLLEKSGLFFWRLAALLARCRSMRICASLAPANRQNPGVIL